MNISNRPMPYYRIYTDQEIWVQACKASAAGDADTLGALITNNRSLQNMHDTDIMRLVREPIQKGYIEILTLLRNTRNRPNFYYHQYMLHLACDNLRDEKLRELGRIQDEENAIRQAKYEEEYRRQCEKSFQHYQMDRYPVVKKEYTPVTDFPAVVKFLLENNCDVNCRDKNQCTPLHIAAGDGSMGVVNVLLAAGAGIELKDYRGQTPLIAAAKGDNFPCVVKLLKLGADKTNALEEARRYKEFIEYASTYGNPPTTPRELQNETRSSILLALVEEELEDLRTDRSETFVSAMKDFPGMEPEFISKMLEGTHESVHISTKNLDIDGLVHMVDTIVDRAGGFVEP
jgi:hypothetical protein